MAGTRAIGNTLTMTKTGAELEDLVIGNIASIGEISTEADEIDVTTLDSPSGAKEFIQGAKDSGEFAVEVNNVFDGTIATLNSIFDSGATRQFVVGFVSSDLVTSEATLTMSAFVKSRAYGEHTPDGLNKATFTLRITGAPVYAEVA